MIEVIYSFVILISTLLGSLAGLGGGIIIKPVLDVVNYHNVANINFYSSCAVLSMAIYSIGKQLKRGINVEWKYIYCIGTGSIVGGIIGNKFFQLLFVSMDEYNIKVIQSTSICILLIVTIVLLNKKIRIKINKLSLYFVIGTILGIISSFLGIGGGPINVAIFIVFLDVKIKMATIYSIITILFSQASNLLSLYINNSFTQYDISMLLYIIPSAILGGVIGTYLNNKLENKIIRKVYYTTILIVIFINIFTIILNV